MTRHNERIDILVIGLVSIDILHIGGKTYKSIGGAGMYTALASYSSGALVRLLAPRSDIVRDELKQFSNVVDWFGPEVQEDQLPNLEISHHGNDIATLEAIDWGAEYQLSKEFLPRDLSKYKIVHVAALSSAERQLYFLDECLSRGARFVSVGTYSKVVQQEPDTVCKLIAKADAFFMNGNEANLLFGSIDEISYVDRSQIVCITLGRDGVRIIDGDSKSDLSAQLVDVVDPTGAGDTFCGSTLSGLSSGLTILQAARQGVHMASIVITGIGPSAVLSSK